MSDDNTTKAIENVVSSAYVWRESQRLSLGMQQAARHSLLSALEDLDAVRETGKFPPGKWETYD